MCVVGAGGIGQEVAKLCAAAGCTWSAPVGMLLRGHHFRQASRDWNPAQLLHDLLGESEFVTVGVDKETTRLIGRRLLLR